MYILCIPKERSINDLEQTKQVSLHLKAPTELRRNFPIAVIDDKAFSPEHNLKNNNFQITTLGDIRTIEEVEGFPLILCDLQGVGMQLAEDLQGAYLIEEIKSNYPDKVVIAFTGGSSSNAISKRAAKFADHFLRKDASIDEWRDVLDKHIRQLSDPVYVWRRLRIRLVEAGITPRNLMELENAFVANYAKGREATKAALSRTTEATSIVGTVRTEMVSFLTSKFFEFIFSGSAT